MAHPKHLKILKQGVRFWNAWRDSCSQVIPDLSNTNLTGIKLCPLMICHTPETSYEITINLSGVSFYKTCLSNAQLAKANFKGADLREAVLDGAQLAEANFESANLTKARLKDASLWKANFKEAILKEACFIHTDLASALFNRADLEKVTFNRADLMDANFSNANVKGAILSGAYLVRTNFCDANLDDSTLIKVQAKDANFRGASLTGCCIEDWNVNGADLNRVKCKYVYLQYDSDTKSFKDRCPPSGEFSSGQFSNRFQTALNIMDQTFREGVSLAHKSHVTYQIQQIGDNNSVSMDRNINMGSGNYIESNSGVYVQGDYFINMEQDLAQAASQIQGLIEQLLKKGVSVDVAQEQVAKDMGTQAQSNPKMKEKLLKWGQSLGDATASDVVKGVVKLAIRSVGIPLP